MPGRIALQLLTTGPADPGPARPTSHVDRLVAALAASRAAMVPVARLAKRLGIAPETAAAHARHAELASLVDRWSLSPSGPSVALTTLAAARFGLTPAPGRSAWTRPDRARA